jgi:hypothetical protein
MAEEDRQSTVNNDEAGSSEDRLCYPTAPTIVFHDIEKTGVFGPSEPESAVCCTKLLHREQVDVPKSPLPSTDLAGADCCTMLLHQDAKSYAAATMGKPFERSSSPSPRSSLSARRSSGMFVRGRVFYLRVRVPRGLQQGMGRTHIWRSLKTKPKWRLSWQRNREEGPFAYPFCSQEIA